MPIVLLGLCFRFNEGKVEIKTLRFLSLKLLNRFLFQAEMYSPNGRPKALAVCCLIFPHRESSFLFIKTFDRVQV